MRGEAKRYMMLITQVTKKEDRMQREGKAGIPQRFDELFRKLEARLGKASDEVDNMRWHARLNPLRKRRLSDCKKGIEDARKLWRNGDSAVAMGALETTDKTYPSAIGLVHGMSRKQRRSEEAYLNRQTGPALVNDGREARALGSAHIGGGLGGGGGSG